MTEGEKNPWLQQMEQMQARLNHMRRLLRTPLNAIIGYGEMLRADVREESPEALQTTLRRLRRTGQKLLVMVNSHLDSSGLSTAQVDPELERTSARLCQELTPLVVELLDHCAQLKAACLLHQYDNLLPDIDRIHGAGQDLQALLDSMKNNTGLTRALPAGELRKSEARGESSSHRVEPSTLLIVDDNEINRDILLRQLQRDGHTVYAAASGPEALGMLRARKFDLVLLDVMMPGMSGYEVLERLKTEEEWREIPVMILSAADELDNVVRCLETGAEDYLSKPFDPVLLRVRIGSCLERKRLRDQLRERLRAIQNELDIAAGIQQSILPREFPPFPQIEAIDLFAEMIPAREVGGDFYDFFLVAEDRVGLVIGDVSDKGVPAALFMAVTRTLVKSIALTGCAPGACLEQVNRLLEAENRSSMFVTLFYAILNFRTGTLEYSNAGHNRPFLMMSNGPVEALPAANGIALGVMPEMLFRTETAHLQPGDQLFLFTDGISEAFNEAKEMFSEVRLRECLQAAKGTSTHEVIRHVAEEVRSFVGSAPQSDDLTMLMIGYCP
jgi:serine phosphatase RsbU (regulator of sigma subunit)